MWNLIGRVIGICINAVIGALIETAADILYRRIVTDINRQLGIA